MDIDLDKDFKASAARVEELRNGREPYTISHKDEYWIALKKHQTAYVNKTFDYQNKVND